jgi:hypothetical protein
MSNIKQKTQLDDNLISIIDMIKLLLPNTKSKYIELVFEIIKNKNIHRFDYNTAFDLENDEIKKINNFKFLFLEVLINGYFEDNDINLLKKFISLNENKKIKDNDLSKIKSFDQINNIINITELSLLTKENKKLINIILENDKWLILRPLTFESSLKYGSNTKWCTAMNNYKKYFYDYSQKGILIYCLNKVTGYKVAVFSDLSSNEISFWSSEDIRVDSLFTQLTDDIKSILFKIIMEDNPKPNSELKGFKYDEEEWEKGYTSRLFLDNYQAVPVNNPPTITIENNLTRTRFSNAIRVDNEENPYNNTLTINND